MEKSTFVSTDVVNNKERVKTHLFVQERNGIPIMFLDLNWKVNDNFIAIALCKTKREVKSLLDMLVGNIYKYEIRDRREDEWCAIFPSMKNGHDIYIHIRVDNEEILFSVDREDFRTSIEHFARNF